VLAVTLPAAACVPKLVDHAGWLSPSTVTIQVYIACGEVHYIAARTCQFDADFVRAGCLLIVFQDQQDEERHRSGGHPSPRPSKAKDVSFATAVNLGSIT
jgi:hypothetical protein